MTMRIKSAIIVEDHPLVSEIIDDILKSVLPGLQVFYEVDCQKIAMTVHQFAIQFGVFDVTLPHGDAFATIKNCRRQNPAFKAVVLTGEDDKYIITRGISAGVAAVISKMNPKNVIEQQLREALSSDHLVLCPYFARIALEMEALPVTGDVTQREQEVLDLTLKGLSIHKISTVLDISPLTVKKHRQRILAKLGVRTTRELLASPRTT